MRLPHDSGLLLMTCTACSCVEARGLTLGGRVVESARVSVSACRAVSIPPLTLAPRDLPLLNMGHAPSAAASPSPHLSSTPALRDPPFSIAEAADLPLALRLRSIRGPGQALGPLGCRDFRVPELPDSSLGDPLSIPSLAGPQVPGATCDRARACLSSSRIAVILRSRSCSCAPSLIRLP